MSAVRKGEWGAWCTRDDKGNAPTMDHAIVEVIMDIRAMIRDIKNIVTCCNATAIPHILRSVEKNTRRPRRKRRPAPRKEKVVQNGK